MRHTIYKQFLKTENKNFRIVIHELKTFNNKLRQTEKNCRHDGGQLRAPLKHLNTIMCTEGVKGALNSVPMMCKYFLYALKYFDVQ